MRASKARRAAAGSAGTFVHGRVEIEYDLARAHATRVAQAGIKVGGIPLWDAVVSIVGPSAIFTYDSRVEALLSELFDAILAFERSVPPKSLAARDAADRVFEEVVSRLWSSLMINKYASRAFDHALWALATCLRWEGRGRPSNRYMHKGAPFYWAGTAALTLSNLDVGMMLLEAGDQSDSDTYRRAKLSEKGVSFPGRATLSLNPTPLNMLYYDVLAMRKIVDTWLADFSSASGQPAGTSLSLPDCDALLFKNDLLKTESRYLICFLIWTNLVERDPVFRAIRGIGPASRRRQAEWVLGLLTSTEGILKRVVAGADTYHDAVVRLIRRDVKPTPPSKKEIKEALSNISCKFGDDVEKALRFWRRWTPSGSTAGFPWYVRWLEAGRFIRNKTAHILEAPMSVSSKWREIETVARYSLFSALWLLRATVPPTPHPPPQPPTAAVGGTSPAMGPVGTIQPSLQPSEMDWSSGSAIPHD